jgi:hypothetical protein
MPLGGPKLLVMSLILRCWVELFVHFFIDSKGAWFLEFRDFGAVRGLDMAIC